VADTLYTLYYRPDKVDRVDRIDKVDRWAAPVLDGRRPSSVAAGVDSSSGGIAADC